MFFKKFLSTNRNYEFEAKLEDHPLGNQKIYRLHYVEYYRKDEDRGRKGNNIGVVDWPFKPFMFLEGMNRQQAFKVLSYLTDFIEEKYKLEPCSIKSVSMLDDLLNLEEFGFVRVNKQIEEEEIIDLYTVTGRELLFKKSKHYQKYFEWYTEGVTYYEVNTIYNHCGIQLGDFALIEKSTSEGLANKPLEKEKLDPATPISEAQSVMNDFMKKLNGGDFVHEKEPFIGEELQFEKNFIDGQVETYRELLASPLMQEGQEPTRFVKKRTPSKW